MAKVIIKHTCGHRSRRNITGSPEKRESLPAKARGEICINCRSYGEFREAVAFNKKHDLPVLRGDEREVRWAEAIRANLLKGLFEQHEGKRPYIASVARGYRTAAFWIERRTQDPRLTLARAFK